MKRKSISVIVMTVLILVLVLSGCAASKTSSNQENANVADSETTNGRISIVCTNFVEYDFLRQIVGEQADVTMLLKPGAESHSYEPTPQDIITVEKSNLFVYVGGDSDAWVESILESVKPEQTKLLKLIDCVDTVEEELVEGMQPEEEEDEEHVDSDHEEGDHDHEEGEIDEHVWTSPKNAIEIVKKMNLTLDEIDSTNKAAYDENTAAYLKNLEKLDADFQKVVDNGKRKEIIVGDRFPFRYLCEEFGLTYYAAFPGCSTDTEANAATVAFLIDKVKNDNIPVVFHIELSNSQMCDSICESTGAKKEQLNAVHNVTDEDFKAGVTYLQLMKSNVKVLEEALN